MWDLSANLRSVFISVLVSSLDKRVALWRLSYGNFLKWNFYWLVTFSGMIAFFLPGRHLTLDLPPQGITLQTIRKPNISTHKQNSTREVIGPRPLREHVAILIRRNYDGNGVHSICLSKYPLTASTTVCLAACFESRIYTEQNTACRKRTGHSSDDDQGSGPIVQTFRSQNL